MNKIIKALVSGRLAASGLVTFDRTRIAYFAEFKDGHIGVLNQTKKVAVYTYFEYSVNNEKLEQTITKNPHLTVGLSVNEFFKSVIRNNAAIMECSQENSILDPNFIVQIYTYDPKTMEVRESSLTEYVFETASLAVLEKVNVFQKNADSIEKIGVLTDEFSGKLAKFITKTISDNQKKNANRWTVGGALVLNIVEAMEEEGMLIKAFGVLNKKAEHHGTPQIQFVDVIVSAISQTVYNLNRQVNLELNPCIYLVPKAAGLTSILPAVAQDNVAVKLMD